MKKEYIVRRKKSALLGLCTISVIFVMSLFLTVAAALAYPVEVFPYRDLIVFCLIFFVLPDLIFTGVYLYYSIREKKMPDTQTVAK